MVLATASQVCSASAVKRFGGLRLQRTVVNHTVVARLIRACVAATVPFLAGTAEFWRVVGGKGIDHLSTTAALKEHSLACKAISRWERGFAASQTGVVNLVTTVDLMHFCGYVLRLSE